MIEPLGDYTDDYKQARGALPWPVRSETEQGQWQLEAERWEMGDTDERSPMYCVYRRKENLWERVGDIWSAEAAEHLNNLQAALTAAEQALDDIAHSEMGEDTLRAKLAQAEARLAAANERAEAATQMQRDQITNDGEVMADLEAELALLRPRAVLADEWYSWVKPYQSIAEYMHQQSYWVCRVCHQRGEGDKGIETLQHQEGCSVARYNAACLPAAPVQAIASIPMLLDCPQCNQIHIDLGEWATRLHKTHLCSGCLHEWRPANVATVGVAALEPAAGSQPSLTELHTGPVASADGV